MNRIAINDMSVTSNRLRGRIFNVGVKMGIWCCIPYHSRHLYNANYNKKIFCP